MPAALLTDLQLPSRKDLKRLCLVCKEIRVLATRALYHTVTLSLCQLNDELRTQLHSSNLGLANVRHLRIVATHGSYRHSRYGRPLVHLLGCLPKDRLSTLRSVP